MGLTDLTNGKTGYYRKDISQLTLQAMAFMSMRWNRLFGHCMTLYSSNGRGYESSLQLLDIIHIGTMDEA